MNLKERLREYENIMFDPLERARGFNLDLGGLIKDSPEVEGSRCVWEIKDLSGYWDDIFSLCQKIQKKRKRRHD